MQMSSTHLVSGEAPDTHENKDLLGLQARRLTLGLQDLPINEMTEGAAQETGYVSLPPSSPNGFDMNFNTNKNNVINDQLIKQPESAVNSDKNVGESKDDKEKDSL